MKTKHDDQWTRNKKISSRTEDLILASKCIKTLTCSKTGEIGEITSQHLSSSVVNCITGQMSWIFVMKYWTEPAERKMGSGLCLVTCLKTSRYWSFSLVKRSTFRQSQKKEKIFNCTFYVLELYFQDKELLLQVLQFTALLIEHSFTRHLYNSMEHLTTLLASSDMTVVLGVLNLLYVFQVRFILYTRTNCIACSFLGCHPGGSGRLWEN